LLERGRQRRHRASKRRHPVIWEDIAVARGLAVSEVRQSGASARRVDQAERSRTIMALRAAPKDEHRSRIAMILPSPHPYSRARERGISSALRATFR